MEKIKLLEDGAFEIISKQAVIRGRFCTWQMKRFCQKQGISSIGDMIERITVSLTIEDVVQYLLTAVEYVYLKENKMSAFSYNDLDACEWIDEMGGIQGDTIVKLIEHSIKNANANVTQVEQPTT